MSLSQSTAADTYSGCLSVVGNTQFGNGVLQFFIQESFNGIAGGFELVFEGNEYTETNGSIILSGPGTANFADLYSHITLRDNSIYNVGKGLLAFDGATGTVAARSTALPVHAVGNTLTLTALVSGWADIVATPGLMARRTSRISGVLVEVDESARPVQEPPT
jgi:hypothetical protein